MSKMKDASVLLLSTKGRKSGKTRTNPLLYIVDRGGYVLVASAGGAPHHPGWYHNLKAADGGTIQVKNQKTEMSFYEVKSDEEYKRLWKEVTNLYPGYEDYKEKTDRKIPIVILTPKLKR